MKLLALSLHTDVEAAASGGKAAVEDRKALDILKIVADAAFQAAPGGLAAQNERLADQLGNLFTVVFSCNKVRDPPLTMLTYLASISPKPDLIIFRGALQRMSVSPMIISGQRLGREIFKPSIVMEEEADA